MADIPVILTCADYARVMPLVTGDVKPEGIALTVIHGTGGSWEMRAEMLRRALDDPTVQGGEASMAGHLRRIDKGDRSHVGLPVFPLRNFTARDLYVRKGGPVKSPADLIGKRIGMYDWVASGSIWYRHFLRFIDMPPENLQWWIGDIDATRAPTHLYDRARLFPADRLLSAAAPDHPAPRRLGAREMDCAQPNQGVYPLQRRVRGRNAQLPVCVALA